MQGPLRKSNKLAGAGSNDDKEDADLSVDS
jgi:hypothetical protein